MILTTHDIFFLMHADDIAVVADSPGGPAESQLSRSIMKLMNIKYFLKIVISSKIVKSGTLLIKKKCLTPTRITWVLSSHSSRSQAWHTRTLLDWVPTIVCIWTNLVTAGRVNCMMVTSLPRIYLCHIHTPLFIRRISCPLRGIFCVKR